MGWLIKGGFAPFFYSARGIPVRKGVENVESMHPHAAEQEDSFCMPEMQKLDRGRQAKWDKRHMRTVSTKLRKEEYAELLDTCMLWGVKPYTLIRRLVRVHVLGREDKL